MNVTRTGPTAFTAQFETEAELRDEHRVNLAFGALRLPYADVVPIDTALTLTLRGPEGGQIDVKAKVVAGLPDGIALLIESDPEEVLKRLLEAAPQGTKQTVWDRMRTLPHVEKVFVAQKADRAERAVLIQDIDYRIQLALLKNPKIAADEVVRMAKSPSLNHQVAEAIVAIGQWMGNTEVKLALINNPKTMPALALRIVPTLPEVELRAIAKNSTNQQLKQAALRKLQKRS
jgi:hypothetical protein